MSDRLVVALGLGVLLIACDAAPPGSNPSDSSVAIDAGTPAPGADAGAIDAAAPDDSGSSGADAGSPTPGVDAGPAPVTGPPPGWPENRAWDWVRSHPMFISALVSQMGDPPRAAVDEYFDDFDANAIHLWETGLPRELDGWHEERPGMPWLTWLHGDGTNVTNGMVLGGYPAGAPGRIGYQLGDEPREWPDMDEIMTGLAAVRDADPDGLRIVNYSWWADELDGFVDRYCSSGLGDIISYDLYSRSNVHYETLAYFREVGLRCQMPYWRYIKGYIADGDDGAPQSRSDMRWAAFVGLTYGYTGHSWFIYKVRDGDTHGIPSTFFGRAGDWTAPRTERFGWAAQLNREMELYGRALTQLMSTDVGWATDSPFTGLHPPTGVDLFRSDMDPYLESVELTGRFVDALLGFFVDANGDRYVIVQNPNHSDGSFPTDNDDRLRGTLRFDFAGATGVSADHVQVIDPSSGTVVTRRIVDGGLPIDLEAGDILFLKYDTGRPFAGF